MITIISGSNRKGSECLIFAEHFYHRLKEKADMDVKLLALESIPHDWFFPEMYGKGKLPESFINIQDEYIIPAKKFLFVCPEYNGSITGALKLFIDACSVREYSSEPNKSFKGKKAAVVGVASGRAGNLLGLDHLVAVLNHLGVATLPKRLPISKIHSVLEDNKIIDNSTISAMEETVDNLLNF